ncbi:hypothetical protein EMIHUDRAFT_244351 [Emiliania huxleyi CCMP1516]|uniref:Uncharacterized protein n=2 Tax=Emiliania huxleyi TaxID=2903 RepID=A0A0D3J0W9_EMIH1|nr:hypothetical protein EMIHUDRAFT_244351 [Emiliania huxleyi CCMP1516]EOD17154.1 hypothetical protein EMIHUDRAFT_244351 [Emiliania huxleyi CCMP1516]|eukprot:XP_005769583.1 hypothetical protein EMIHUDRAFT_244351 [Emiliania huxleyi CCMP1516]
MFARTSAAARLLRCGGARARAAGRSRSLSGATEVAALGIPAQVVVAAQAATGAPWWLAIGGTTVALRVGMLPLLWYQLAETRRFGALRPQLAAIRDECRAIEPPSARAAQTLLRGWRCCRAASVQPLAIVAVPLVQIPLLIWSLELLKARRPAEAVDVLWPAILAAPREDSGPLRFQCALALHMQSQHAASAELLKQVIELEPSFAEAHLCLAQVYTALGLAAEAEAALDEAATLRPEIAGWNAEKDENTSPWPWAVALTGTRLQAGAVCRASSFRRLL